MCKLVDEKYAAQYLCCSVAKLQKDRTKGVGVRYARIGRLIRYDLSDLDEHIKDSTFVSTSQYGDKK